MDSDRPTRGNHHDCNEPSTPTDIPHFARAWESFPQVASSVRRPSPLPDPELYHEAIESESIFELDEKQKDGSIEAILVVPFGCKRCKSSKQACSRAQPTCVRCSKGGSICEALQEGYQRLPRPKYGKPSHLKKSTGSASKPSNAGFSAPLEFTASRLRVRQMDSGAESLSYAPPPNSGRPTNESKRSKRPSNHEIDSVPPRKKEKRVNTTSRNKKGRRPTVVASKETDTEPSESAADPLAPTVESTSEHSALEWIFVRNPRRRDGQSSPAQKPMDSMPANTPIPRVWANSLNGLLTVFPELAKTPVGFSWFHCDTPVFLLDNNFAKGHWISSTTLSIDLLWDFSCFDFELEPTVESGTESATQSHFCQPVVHSSESTLDHDVDMMDLPHLEPSPGIESLSMCLAISAPEVGVTVRAPPLDDNQQNGPYASQGTSEYYTGGRSPILDTTRNELVSVVRSPPSDPGSPLSDPPSSPLHSTLNDSITYQTTTTQANFQPRIPVKKPPEVDTLLDSHHRAIPLLLWTARCSELTPCNLLPEYAYSCMGLFFISDLRHTVIKHDVPPTAGVVQARVCWSLTLQWAPGGEDALFDTDSTPPGNITSDSELLDTARDFSHPWWFVPTDPSPQADDTTPYRPRDLRMQFSSFIPLDLLAEFHPSESFPRGWFCKSCGMINIQEFFRHQICRSTTCESLRKKGTPQGKADSLSSLRDPYQSNTLIRPTSNIPSAVVSDSIPWDDGMQSWIYAIRDGVTLCHVFTGNQERLQEDATALLEKIQCELLLRRDDTSSPYFVHTTRLLHSSGKSETMVPTGTSDCVRIAYYTLCDFVHQYGEMDKPRFGVVRMQAWANSGSRKGYILRASKSPVVIHCLGAEVVLKFTPEHGYEEAVEPTVPDKGKGRMGSPFAEPRAGPSQHLEQVVGNQTPIPAHSEGESPIVAEHVDEATAVMDTTRQRHSLEAAGTPGLKTPHLDPEIEMAHDEVIEPKRKSVGKKNKLAKDKTKASIPEISMTLVHGDCVVLSGDNFECQIVRTGTTILVIGLPEET